MSDYSLVWLIFIFSFFFFYNTRNIDNIFSSVKHNQHRKIIEKNGIRTMCYLICSRALHLSSSISFSLFLCENSLRYGTSVVSFSFICGRRIQTESFWFFISVCGKAVRFVVVRLAKLLYVLFIVMCSCLACNDVMVFYFNNFYLFGKIGKYTCNSLCAWGCLAGFVRFQFRNCTQIW